MSQDNKRYGRRVIESQPKELQYVMGDMIWRSYIAITLLILGEITTKEGNNIRENCLSR